MNIKIHSLSTGQSIGKIEYGTAPTPFGNCLVAHSEKGICMLQFIDENEQELISELHDSWKDTILTRNDKMAIELADTLFYSHSAKATIDLCVKGTPFQINVWETLLKVPLGTTVTYQELAEMRGKKTATRAVASAVARNPIGYIIPCHRVIRTGGAIGKYHWKPERKAAIIEWEKRNKE